MRKFGKVINLIILTDIYGIVCALIINFCIAKPGIARPGFDFTIFSFIGSLVYIILIWLIFGRHLRIAQTLLLLLFYGLLCVLIENIFIMSGLYVILFASIFYVLYVPVEYIITINVASIVILVLETDTWYDALFVLGIVSVTAAFGEWYVSTITNHIIFINWNVFYSILSWFFLNFVLLLLKKKFMKRKSSSNLIIRLNS
jgi:hypothetical protein